MMDKFADFLHNSSAFKLIMAMLGVFAIIFIFLFIEINFIGRNYLKFMNVEIEGNPSINSSIIWTINESIGKIEGITKDEFVDFLESKNVSIYFGEDDFYFTPYDRGYIIYEYNDVDINIYVRNSFDLAVLQHELIHLVMTAAEIPVEEQHQEMQRLRLCYGGCESSF